MRPGGLLVVVGNVQPGTVPFNPALGTLKEIEIVGSSHAPLDDLVQVIDLVARGRMTPDIAAVFGRTEVALGHALMKAKGTVGRVVLPSAPQIARR